MLRFITFISLFLVESVGIYADDSYMTRDFIAQIKSVDEFVQRFNGKELHPDIETDSTDNNESNLWSLFDYDILRSDGAEKTDFEMIKGFISTVLSDGIQMRLNSEKVVAVAELSATVLGFSVDLSMSLQQQMIDTQHIRWAIVGVEGLFSSGIFNLDEHNVISPIQHEINFMALEDIFSLNSQDIFGYRGNQNKLDELSVFLTLARVGMVKIKDIAKVVIHCNEVPGYSFRIEECVRRGNNSGWLITGLEKLN